MGVDDLLCYSKPKTTVGRFRRSGVITVKKVGNCIFRNPVPIVFYGNNGIAILLVAANLNMCAFRCVLDGIGNNVI